MTNLSETMNPQRTGAKTRSRAAAWAMLLAVFAGLYVFADWVGPWLETRIPVFDKIVETIEKQDINSVAYDYTEIKGSLDGERYLRTSLETQAPDQAKFSLQFCSGIFFCLALLALGFRYLPND